MAELTFPTGLAPKQLPAGYGNAGADEVALLNQYGRGIRGDPGIMLPQIMAARRRQQAADDYMAQQTQQANQQGERMYGDYIGRADNLAQSKQAIDLLDKRKDAPITGMPQLRKFITPGAEGAFQAVDEQNFAKGGAEVEKLDSEALAQRATAANNADQAGYGIDPRLLRLGNFTKGLGRQERVEHIQGGYNLKQEKLKGDNQGKASISTTYDDVNGVPKTVIKAPTVEGHNNLKAEFDQSKAPQSGRPGSTTRDAVAKAQKTVESVIQQNGAKAMTPVRVLPQGNDTILQVRVQTKDGATRDLEYIVGPDGTPKLRKR